MILPPPLHPGDTIGVMAPSSYVEQADILESAALLEARGYKVFVHPQTYERHHQSAGKPLQKSLAFQGLWQRKDIKAIWAAGGGNRALHLLDIINFNALTKKPKALIGFSDVTALLNAVYAHTGIITYHGPVFKNIHRCRDTDLDQCLNLLRGQSDAFPLEDADVLSEGEATGPLVGGNLSIFQYLPQTLPGNFYDGALIFLEDCDEELSKIDRMILHLKRTGVLNKAAGLIFGQFTGLKDTGRPFGFTLEDIIAEHTQDLNIPVIMNVPFGHGEKLYTLPVGQHATLNTSGPALLLRT